MCDPVFVFMCIHMDRNTQVRPYMVKKIPPIIIMTIDRHRGSTETYLAVFRIWRGKKRHKAGIYVKLRLHCMVALSPGLGARLTSMATNY